MTTRTLLISMTLTATLSVALLAIVVARPAMTEAANFEPTTTMQPGRNRMRNVPAPTPSPNTKRPKPIQSPKPRR